MAEAGKEKKRKTKTKVIKSGASHLHVTSVANVMRSGAHDVLSNKSSKGGVRLTGLAIKEATERTEMFLKELGSLCQHFLELKRAKTVTRPLLMDVLSPKSKGHDLFSRGEDVVRDSIKEKGKKAGRNNIAISSAVKSFGEGIKLGGGHFRIAEEAKNSLSKLAEAYIQNLAKRAASYANAAKRSTITQGDIVSAGSYCASC